MALGTCTLSLIPFFMPEPVIESLVVSDAETSTTDSKQEIVESARNHQQQCNRPIHYTTRRFVVELSAQSVSSLAIGRFGDAYGPEEIVDRVSCV